MLQVDDYRLSFAAELDELCLCKDASATGILCFLNCRSSVWIIKFLVN